MGERFIKKILDYAIINNINEIYVTIFPKHIHLISLLEKYGFTKAAKKTTKNGTEEVLIKNLSIDNQDIILNYPRISISQAKKFLLAINPEYHTTMFPDSKLFGEKYDLIQDTSHTNSIHKIYLCSIYNIKMLKSGDILVMYRTSDKLGPALYRSVATSICTVEEVLTRKDFADINEFLKFCEALSVFNKETLSEMYRGDKSLYVIKMIYNAALTKRLNRERLIKEIGINADYWGFVELTSSEFSTIIKKGEVNESIIIN